MDAALHADLTRSAQDREIAATVRRERGRLLAFIRRRVLDAAEAEDVLQEALYELVAAHRLMQPIEQAGAWLMRVARNRIIDRFRKRRIDGVSSRITLRSDDDPEEESSLEDLMPSIEPGPEGEAMRQMLLERVEEALDDLPREQREVF